MNTTQQDSIVDNFDDKFIQFIGIQFTEAELSQLPLNDSELLVSSRLVKKLMDLLVSEFPMKRTTMRVYLHLLKKLP